ncbi:hypothetical protein NC99_18700 [Sunxiuqinia dokdonensis]|uniref:Uncharacterized protein n=1 Tax=Sunxiuqinia dokdonensis TaxID=1409788 RepID=A0A0L8VAZ1_9BACT|nr:hypothetical protein NC99_18700 [Sunxiuqinia dokdonensis]
MDNRFSFIENPFIKKSFKILFAQILNSVPLFEFTRYPTAIIMSRL